MKIRGSAHLGTVGEAIPSCFRSQFGAAVIEFLWLAQIPGINSLRQILDGCSGAPSEPTRILSPYISLRWAASVQLHPKPRIRITDGK